MKTSPNKNPLYPIFLKLHELKMLIVGAGGVGHEKLSFILKSSPDAQITVVAPDISLQVITLLHQYKNHRVIIRRRPFKASDVLDHDLIIAATDLPDLNQEIQAAAKTHRRLINVADSPGLCDFYLGSIVTKGQLKIGISTNGQSPTLAKRMRQLLEDVLPEDIQQLLKNLKSIRDRLGGDFADKVRQLNELTANLIEEKNIK